MPLTECDTGDNILNFDPKGYMFKSFIKAFHIKKLISGNNWINCVQRYKRCISAIEMKVKLIFLPYFKTQYYISGWGGIRKK